MANDAALCKPSEPVAVLQIHGTLDPLVLFNGFIGLYPGAEDIVKRVFEVVEVP